MRRRTMCLAAAAAGLALVAVPPAAASPDPATARRVAPLPADFLWGVSSSGFQAEGSSPDSNWMRLAPPDNSRIRSAPRPTSCTATPRTSRTRQHSGPGCTGSASNGRACNPDRANDEPLRVLRQRPRRHGRGHPPHADPRSLGVSGLGGRSRRLGASGDAGGLAGQCPQGGAALCLPRSAVGYLQRAGVLHPQRDPTGGLSPGEHSAHAAAARPGAQHHLRRYPPGAAGRDGDQQSRAMSSAPNRWSTAP